MYKCIHAFSGLATCLCMDIKLHINITIHLCVSMALYFHASMQVDMDICDQFYAQFQLMNDQLQFIINPTPDIIAGTSHQVLGIRACK